MNDKPKQTKTPARDALLEALAATKMPPARRTHLDGLVRAALCEAADGDLGAARIARAYVGGYRAGARAVRDRVEEVSRSYISGLYAAAAIPMQAATAVQVKMTGEHDVGAMPESIDDAMKSLEAATLVEEERRGVDESRTVPSCEQLTAHERDGGAWLLRFADGTVCEVEVRGGVVRSGISSCDARLFFREHPGVRLWPLRDGAPCSRAHLGGSR